MESWGKLFCPSCKAVNWICLGDMNDMTLPDVEGVCCHACKHKFRLDPDFEDNDDEEDDIDYDNGLAAPR